MTIKKESPTDQRSPFSGVQPSAHLPRLSSLNALPQERRRAALAAWTAWLNANRNVLEQRDEEKLDDALQALERDATAGTNEAKLDEQVDQWLDQVLDANRDRDVFARSGY